MCCLSLAHVMPLTSTSLQSSCPIGLSTPQPKGHGYLYPMVLHILHTGNTNQSWVPSVHSLQLHVDQEAVWGSLQGGQWPSAKVQLGRAEAPRRKSKCCAWESVACQSGEARAPFWLAQCSHLPEFSFQHTTLKAQAGTAEVPVSSR